MKKVIKTAVVVLLLMPAAKAQTIWDKSVHKGNIVTNLYYGFYNSLTAALQNTSESTDEKKEQLKSAGVGPVGIRASYLVTGNLDAGGEVSFESACIHWKERGMLQVNDPTNPAAMHNFILQAQRIRILIKLNYYFAIKTQHNWYFDVGVGYNHTHIRLDTDAPYIRNDEISSLCFFPLSAQTKLGFNYYFTKNIGVNAEVGLGGPLVSMGVTAKFL